jgi:hypothetical protein
MIIGAGFGRSLVLHLGFDSTGFSVNFNDEGRFVQMPFLFSFKKGIPLTCP